MFTRDSIFENYISKVFDALRKIDLRAYKEVLQALIDVHRRDATVFICGNGGSAATASHMVNDLVKAPAEKCGCKPFRAISLTDNVPLFTAFSNDVGYKDAFTLELKALARPGDLLIIFTGSGNSQNVVEAAQFARNNGIRVVCITGFAGGKIREFADIHLNVPSDHMPQIEDAHLIIEHALVEDLKIILSGSDL